MNQNSLREERDFLIIMMTGFQKAGEWLQMRKELWHFFAMSYPGPTLPAMVRTPPQPLISCCALWLYLDSRSIILLHSLTSYITKFNISTYTLNSFTLLSLQMDNTMTASTLMKILRTVERIKSRFLHRHEPLLNMKHT